MSELAAGRNIWTIGVAVAVVVLVIVGLPLVASTLIVRDNVARQLSAWSGYHVEMGEAPQIRVWPSFRAVLSDVTLSAWNAGDPPVMEAERVEVDLSALAALRGEVVFTRIRLVRPTIRVEAGNALFRLADAPSGGRLRHAVEQARGLLKANPAKPDLSALPRDSVGAVEIQDGKIVGADGDAETEMLSGLAATLDWSALDRAATLSATGIWHGETISVNASSPQPLMLLAGATAPAMLTLKSAPLNIAFDGMASVSNNFFVDGDLGLSAPSLKRMLEWVGTGVSQGDAIGAVDISCHVSGSAKRLKFEKAQIKLDGNPARGVLDVSFGQAPVGIAGTLAFKTLDLRSFVSAFAQLPARPSASDEPVKTASGNRFDVDLRVSAASATAGSIALSDVAATAQLKGALTAFDISDAKVFDGMLQLGLRVDRKVGGNVVELRIVADDIDGSMAASKLGWRFMPRARGSLSVILKGIGPHWEHVFETAAGSITATFGKGTMPGLDLAGFLEHSARGGFFPLSDVEDGSLPIDGAELKASVIEGVARIDKAEARSAGMLISLGGLIPFAGRGLALSGTISPLRQAQGNSGGDGSRTAFFVGGSWASPFVSPVLPRLPPG